MTTTGLLSGVRVIELGEGVSAPYCGKILAQMGAEVIKIEPPQGDISRRIGPFPGDAPHTEKSGLFLALNLNKFGVVLNLSEYEDRKHLLRLVESSDIVIENLPIGRLEKLGLDYHSLRNVNPSIILTSITPFGKAGPYSVYKATDLTLFHMSGHAHSLLGPVEDPNSDPPIRAGGHQTEFVAGMAAATSTLMALFRKRMTGVGSHIDLSAYGAMVTQLISGLSNIAHGQPAPPRALGEVKEAATGGMVTAIGGVLPCKDGYVAISPREDAQWERWIEVMGNPEWASDERFATRKARESNSPALWELLSNWSRQFSKSDIARWGQEKRIPCFPVNTVEDLFKDEHLAYRQFFKEINHPVAGMLKYPGTPYRLLNTKLPLDARPAPLLGEHNDLILGQKYDE